MPARIKDVTGPAPSEPEASPATERILSAAFTAFMEDGYTGASTLKIATRAKVSKRELYTLFGNKHGLLKACVVSRANRMQPPQPPPTPRDARELEATLVAFGTRLLEEITHPTVVAVHRLAVAESPRSLDVGVELDEARRQVRESVREWLVRAQGEGYLSPGDPLEMASVLLALLMRDSLVRLMEGLVERPSPAIAKRRAAHAAAAFLRIYAAPPPNKA